MKPQNFTTELTEKKNFDVLVISRHSREGGNPVALNFLKRMDSRLRTSGMTDLKRLLSDAVNLRLLKNSVNSVVSFDNT
jgi:hypothetical protein